jgi:adenylosuccinate synthase
MPANVVVGTQWGDEGKGKVVDFLARDADIVVRSQGGNNAGHTVAVGEETFRLYHLPCGVLHPEKTSIIASGMGIQPLRLLDEIEGLEARGFPCTNLVISHHAHLIMPYHILLDELEEGRRKKRYSRGMIGTTKRGIGPVFADKMARSGLRVCDLASPDYFREHVMYVCAEKNALFTGLYDADPLDPDEIVDEYLGAAPRLLKFAGDAVNTIIRALDEDKHVLFEGAQGTLLDIDYGVAYPFLTSSHPVSGGMCIGTGLAPNRINRVYGVVKAYISRVGEGPFPSELSGEMSDLIRDRGNEYGTATGRPRRVGWLDLVLLRYSARINGLTDIVLTKVDVLDELPEIQVVTSYELDGEIIDYLPSDPSLIPRLKPVARTLPGWLLSTSELASGDKIPGPLQDYMNFITRSVGVPITLLGVGTRRRQMVEIG